MTKSSRKKFRTGLVVGKFYPPHAGHSYLIERAHEEVDNLTVMVCHRDDQGIHGELRAAWLRELHPYARVVVVQDIMEDDDSAAWAKYTISILGNAPEAVFSSEDYGDTYARCMGSRHVLIDKARIAVSISATRIRKDPYANWEYLSPPVRAYFAKRVCVVGAESTGTTTMAHELAVHYNTVWVPEFGRTYWEGKMPARNASVWTTDEFVFIADMQNRLEDRLARVCNRLLIGDTNSFATSLWHERYMGYISPEVEAQHRAHDPDLYLLTDSDIPFVQDGTRDGEHIRHDMHKRFADELERGGVPYIVLSGSRGRRFKKAVEACDALFLNVPSLA